MSAGITTRGAVESIGRGGGGSTLEQKRHDRELDGAPLCRDDSIAQFGKIGTGLKPAGFGGGLSPGRRGRRTRSTTTPAGTPSKNWLPLIGRSAFHPVGACGRRSASSVALGPHSVYSSGVRRQASSGKTAADSSVASIETLASAARRRRSSTICCRCSSSHPQSRVVTFSPRRKPLLGARCCRESADPPSSWAGHPRLRNRDPRHR